MLSLALSLLAAPVFAHEIDRIMICRSSEGSIPRNAELVYVEHERAHVQLPPEAVTATVRGVVMPVTPTAEMPQKGVMTFTALNARTHYFTVYENGSFTFERRMFGPPDELASGRCEAL